MVVGGRRGEYALRAGCSVWLVAAPGMAPIDP